MLWDLSTMADNLPTLNVFARNIFRFKFPTVKFVFKDPTDNRSSLVKVMVWLWRCDNLSPWRDDDIVYWHIYAASHDDVMKWKHFLRYWSFVRGVPGEFPAQRPVTRSFDVFFDLRLNKLLSKQSWGSWFETLLRPLRRNYNVFPKWISRIQHVTLRK